MASVTHTVVGMKDPTEAPPSIGAHYTNQLNGARYISNGTASVADWGAPLAGKAAVYDITTGTVTLIPGQPAVHWTVDSSKERTLYFEVIEAPGLYKFEVVIESYNSAQVLVDTDSAIGQPYFKIADNFTVLPESANYYIFACWVTSEGRNIWTMLESRLLDGDRQKVSELDDTVSTGTLTEKNPLTAWEVYTQKDRTLILPQFIGPGTLIEHTLILRNDMQSELVVAIDEAEGFPLRDHASLVVPALTVMMYKLAYYPNGGAFKWSVLSSHVL